MVGAIYLVAQIATQTYIFWYIFQPFKNIDVYYEITTFSLLLISLNFPLETFNNSKV